MAGKATNGRRAALITGAARRIGRALALDLARDGWAIVVHYHGSETDALDVVAAIEADGGRAAAVAADLANERETETLIGRAAAAVGPLGVLINNASLFENDTVETVTKASFDAHLAINTWAPLQLTQAFAAGIESDSESQGNVINILDQRVWNLTPFFTSYTVSKAGLWTLTQTLAMALAPRIRVNGIGPGPTLPSKRQSAEHFAEQWRRTPLARPVDPAEICRAVRFILATPSMTGQMIALDSGQHLGASTGQNNAEALE